MSQYRHCVLWMKLWSGSSCVRGLICDPAGLTHSVFSNQGRRPVRAASCQTVRTPGCCGDNQSSSSSTALLPYFTLITILLCAHNAVHMAIIKQTSSGVSLLLMLCVCVCQNPHSFHLFATHTACWCLLFLGGGFQFVYIAGCSYLGAQF